MEWFVASARIHEVIGQPNNHMVIFRHGESGANDPGSRGSPLGKSVVVEREHRRNVQRKHLLR